MATVLVVDDEFGIGDLLDGLLADEGHHVVLAANGREALEKLAETKVDLILSDFMMPVMDGAEFFCAVRALPGFAAIPFLVMCALPEDAVADRLSGYDAFIRKPFRIQTILDAVERALAKPDA